MNNLKMSEGATPTGTATYAKKFRKQCANDFFSISTSGLTLSSIGIGTYKGEVNNQGDEQWVESIRYGLKNGINLLDTAIRYRSMRSEKMIARVLKELIDAGEIKREELFISTKGGLIAIPENTKRESYVVQEIIKKRNINRKKIYKNLHCLDPKFLNEELNISLQNLGLKTIDCYFLHNPELNLLLGSQEQFYSNLYKVFEMLESRVDHRDIATYGLSSWNGFRRREGGTYYLNIDRIMNVAREVGGEQHHFKYLELPLSVGMPFIYNNRITSPDGNSVRFLERVKTLGMDVLASATLYEGKLKELINLQNLMKLVGMQDSENNLTPSEVSIPLSDNSIVQLFELLLALREKQIDLESKLSKLSGKKLGLYPCALNIARSTPEVLSALVGMEQIDYTKDNLQLIQYSKIDPEKIKNILTSLSLS